MRKKIRQTSRDLLKFCRSSQSILLLFIEICVGSAVVLESLFVFLRLADSVLEKEVISVDTVITKFVYIFRSPAITEIMKSISFLGTPAFLGTAIITTILILIFKKRRKDALVFSFILFFALVLNLLLKDLFQRPRPTLLPLVHESSYSFPSGHSMNSFVYYMSLCYFIFRNTRNKKLGIILTTLSIFLVTSIGLSRIYLGAHFPSDVVAGFAAGALWFVIVLVFEKTLIFMHLFREYELNKKY